jgi:uncharacterized membrane protein
MSTAFTPGSLRLGNRVAPPRFIAFALILIVAAFFAVPAFGWRHGIMAAFDLAAFLFLLSCIPLFNNATQMMRDAAARNDANRAGLLALTAAVGAVILVAVASELMQKDSPKPLGILLIIGTLALCWTFSNMIYALHYAHMFYVDDGGADTGGLDFPGTKEPDYWDFVYFSFCLGMTFQTSDVEMHNGHFRRVSTFHCLAAFIFNLGIIAFTINVLGG